MAAKKVAVKKVVEVKKEVKKVCPNCENSGMTCNTCGVGQVQG